MGANTIPIEKKRGSTVLGVRMGLLAGRQRSIAGKRPIATGNTAYCHAFNRCCRNAVSVWGRDHQHPVTEHAPSFRDIRRGS